MARYLIQDHRFLDSFLVLLRVALASAYTFAPGCALVASSAWCRPRKTLFPSGVRSARRHRDQARSRSRYAADHRLQGDHARSGGDAQLCGRAWWPNGCISIGPPAHRSRCQTTSDTRSVLRCTTIRIFVGSSNSCARSWTVLAAHADLCRDFFSRAVTLELSFFEAAHAT